MPGPLSEAQFKPNIKAHPENKSEYELGIQYTHTHVRVRTWKYRPFYKCDPGTVVA